jgi:hypothetical protein
MGSFNGELQRVPGSTSTAQNLAKVDKDVVNSLLGGMN